MDDMKRTFADEAVACVARKAIARKTGARGLRSILEAILLDPMFDLPNMNGVEEVVISPDVVEGRAKPLLIRSEEHTSELQSLMRISYAVFCLKKKKKKTHINMKIKIVKRHNKMTAEQYIA